MIRQWELIYLNNIEMRFKGTWDQKLEKNVKPDYTRFD